ncbi:MerR family DNA-binding transcriptional regulator [Rouxiella badensis]|uniref:MerR family DNA-binding transcriptional regulator n=1 Tax=Rouxiella badensis TaxID=1646377 RepID=UPI001D13EED0|nr:MerR family DNA-binding transcriptional regulator [Rouxiella badensis]MCC3702805.1 MerR family DNA-binding transcriptional regulator [Rouxiella badensis]
MHSSHPNTPRPLARHYSIETTAQLCGVLPITLRTWQRYGLIHPQRDAKGSRWYSAMPKGAAGTARAILLSYIRSCEKSRTVFRSRRSARTLARQSQSG